MMLLCAVQKLLTTIAKIDQDYYPEHLGTMASVGAEGAIDAARARAWTSLAKRLQLLGLLMSHTQNFVLTASMP